MQIDADHHITPLSWSSVYAICEEIHIPTICITNIIVIHMLSYLLSLGWQPRWFVLAGGTLSYYDSQEDAWKGCKGSIKISVCEIQGKMKSSISFFLCSGVGCMLFLGAMSLIFVFKQPLPAVYLFLNVHHLQCTHQISQELIWPYQENNTSTSGPSMQQRDRNGW